MGLAGMARRRNLSVANKAHEVFPYLLRGMEITRVRQVWSTDITYIPVQEGYAYLCAIIDWQIRCVLSWALSNTLDASFCIRAVELAIAEHEVLVIFNVSV